MITIDHLALKTTDLLATYRFYHEQLGLAADYNLEVGRLWVEGANAVRLIFVQADTAPDPEAVAFIGLELADFAAVDALYARLAATLTIERDVRETYRHTKGPYGFFILDPNGYRLKIFRYHDVS